MKQISENRGNVSTQNEEVISVGREEPTGERPKCSLPDNRVKEPRMSSCLDAAAEFTSSTAAFRYDIEDRLRTNETNLRLTLIYTWVITTDHGPAYHRPTADLFIYLQSEGIKPHQFIALADTTGCN